MVPWKFFDNELRLAAAYALNRQKPVTALQDSATWNRIDDSSLTLGQKLFRGVLLTENLLSLHGQESDPDQRAIYAVRAVCAAAYLPMKSDAVVAGLLWRRIRDVRGRCDNLDLGRLTKFPYPEATGYSKHSPLLASMVAQFNAIVIRLEKTNFKKRSKAQTEQEFGTRLADVVYCFPVLNRFLDLAKPGQGNNGEVSGGKAKLREEVDAYIQFLHEDKLLPASVRNFSVARAGKSQG